jgi:CRP-like cAMP-binding protein
VSESEVEQLRRVPIFASLSDAELERVASVAAPFEVEGGHVLAETAQPGSGMFVIADGSVEVSLPSGRMVSLGPGEFFGELSLLADVDRVARVRATSTVRGFAIGRAAFDELLRAEPQIAVAMLPVVAKRLADTVD